MQDSRPSQQHRTSWLAVAKSLVNVQVKRFLIQHASHHNTHPALFGKVLNAFTAPLPVLDQPSRLALEKKIVKLKKDFFKNQIAVLRFHEGFLRRELQSHSIDSVSEWRFSNFLVSRKLNFKKSCKKLCGCDGPKVTLVSREKVVLEISEGCKDFKLTHGNRRALQFARSSSNSSLNLSQSDESLVEILLTLNDEDTVTGGVKNFFLERKLDSMLQTSFEKSQLPNEHLDNCVFNYSKLVLTPAVEKILSKGLKFIPTRNLNESDCRNLEFDASRLTRSLLLKDYFFEKAGEKQDQDLGSFPEVVSFKPQSNFCPSSSNFASTNNFIKGFEALTSEESIKNYKIPVKHNLAFGELKLIKELGRNEEIVIKPADKGSGVVILDKSDYIKKAEELLLSEDYTKLEDDPMPKWIKKTDELIQKGVSLGLWPQKESKWLRVKKPQIPALYGLPKVHKAGVPLRPVVSSIDSPSMNLAKLIDLVLQPFVKSTTGFLQDTKHFLQVIESLNKAQDLENSKLFSLDVEALYPSIPHKEAVQVVKHFVGLLDWEQDKIQFFVDLVDFVLGYSFFEFNGSFYKQNRGVPIGSKCGCSIACVYMRFLEEEFFKSRPCNNLKAFFRYIDDVFGVWSGNEDEFNSFFNDFNNFDPFIKFTNTGLVRELNVLDTTVSYNDKEKLKVKLFTKPTDRKMLLNFNSSHPLHIKKALPYMMARRVVMISSENEDKWKELLTLGEVFFRRGYPMRIIKEGFMKALKLTREDCLNSERKKVSQHQDDSFFVTKFLSAINWKELKSNVRNLKEKTGLKRGVKFAYRNDRSLKSLLVHTRLTNNEKKNNKKKRFCGRKNCPICKDVGVFQSGNLQLGRKTIQLSCNFGCKEDNVVYFLFCEKCSLGYVGATTRELSKRFSEHVGKMKNNVKEIQTVHLHFKEKSGCTPKIGILEKTSEDNLFEVEKWYIKKYRPEFNVKDAIFIKDGENYKRKIFEKTTENA